MNFGRGFSIPHENETQIRGPWIPVTPDKPIPTRSQPIPVDKYGNQLGRGNWQQQVGVPRGYLQENQNYNGAVQNFNPIGLLDLNGSINNWGADFAELNHGFNHIVGSYPQAFGNDSAGWNNNPLAELLGIKNPASVVSASGTLNRSIHVANRPLISNPYSQVDSSWRAASLLLANQNHSSGSNLRRNGDSLFQIPQSDGFPVPYRPNYNLNSPPTTEGDAASSVTNSIQFAPVTPDQAKKLENQLSEIPNFSVDESMSHEKEKQDNIVTSIGNEAREHRCDELLQNIVDSSSAAISTSLKEKNDSDKGGDRNIDLNKTPQQKPPRKRKHRPKVIIEGKPKRTRKPSTPKNTNSKENPLQKRKYVRKNGNKASATQQADVVEATDPTVESAAKSCRRVLNFDLENKTRDESRGKIVGHQEEMQHGTRWAFKLNSDSQAQELCTIINSTSGTKSAVQVCQWNGLIGDQQAGTTCNLTSSMNQMPTDYISPERHAPATPPATRKDLHMGTLNVIARNVSTRNANPCQSRGKNGYTPVHQHIHGEGIGQVVFQAKTTRENLERTGQLMSHSNPQSVPKTLVDSNQARGPKREYYHTVEQTHPRTVNLMGSSLLCQEIFQVDDYNNYDSSNFGTGSSEIHKKRKSGNGLYTTVSSMPSGITTVEDGSRQVQTKGRSDVNPNHCTSQINYGILNSYFESDHAPKKLNNAVNNSAGDWYIRSMAVGHNFQKQHSSSELHSHTERTPENRSSGFTWVQDFTSLTATSKCNLLPLTPPKKTPTSGNEQGVEASRANMSTKEQTVGSTLSNLASSSTDKVLLREHKDALYDYQQSSMKTRGPPEKQKYPIPIDNLIRRMKGLNLNGRSNKMVGQEQNALVPYKGQGTIVPYEGFDPIKKRKPRPKVDLDPETNRIWKLLMGKEGSEGSNEMKKDMEKWWEEERKVFRGRADSFIARMHLVQGDRRFSQWKGSVVDSVIGVFLTQNVSDHLSSSAFMSLAAQFPLKSESNNRICYSDGTSILVEEPELYLQDPNDTIKWQVSRQPVYNQNSVTHHESSEHRRYSVTTGTRRTSLVGAHNTRAEEEVISSQDSFDSCNVQAAGEIRSCSGSNSDAEDPTIGCRTNKIQGSTSNDLPQTEKTSIFQEFYSRGNGSSLFDETSKHEHKQSVDVGYSKQKPRLDRVDSLKDSSTFTYPINFNNPHVQVPNFPSSNYRLHMTPDSGVLEVECLEVMGEQSISSVHSTASGITKAKDVGCTSIRIGQMAESATKTRVQQNGPPRSQETPTVGPHALLSKHPMHQQRSSQPGPHTENNQHSCNSHQHQRTQTFQLGSTSVTEPAKISEALAKRQNSTMKQVPNAPMLTGETFDVEERISVVEKQTHLEKKVVEPNSKDHIYSSGEAHSGTNTKTLKARKGKTEGEKKNAFDWDSLRKQVQSNGRKRERSKESMDSLDYEAMRCADVGVISDAIKERGMNNMLAERIKDFLNRLVREHESIDLEWLRDAPPDKVKDYLLSIRGLGLKSVECVRLLTLHHLAFPVDTNVGRIAVRLGWVPLQPLPESLQLHLLELYPVLESIQKYLWPRLCKLDQRTLYELHYQMITFGKVFCTKNKPNCNACPLRGECRHFASAFSSARLALPGPEEKSIVSSTVPISTDRNPAVVINPMQLPPPENNPLGESGFEIGKCEPIIEVPATPEPECTEVSESDIEDAFYEDPDEIPTIKLNIEEFTLNLQNYMQENMEIQEGDMSKALVALNQAAASIPTPKLKNVSRLRTEHQVYELPDSHLLLKGLDKREPDDPSPYLLAIWTPGETANSIQPPERRCESQESGKLCYEKTCFSCNSTREENSQTVRGTLLIPCRTAMRGSFPLNGTYFQVNEMFADHDSSLNPINVPRAWIWNLPRRTVYFGTSVSTIFKGLSTEGIQYCFWRGFVCVRGFHQKTRAPKPLMARLHFPASKLAKTKNESK